MKEYWLVLESYVFLWSDEKEILLYNVLSGKGFIYNNSNILAPVIDKLMDKSNLYTISICTNDLEQDEICSFVQSLRANYCGDLYSKALFPQKPLVVIPELNLNEEKHKGTETIKRDTLAGVHAVKNLLEVTIYLTGQCNLNCNHCNLLYKQLAWCTKGNKHLPLENILAILEQVKSTCIDEVRFIGGDVFAYPELDKLIEELSNYSFRKIFYCNYRLFPANDKRMEYFANNTDLELCLLVDSFPDAIHDFELAINRNYRYFFAVTSFEEYTFVGEYISTNQLNAKILPYYTGRNLDFFKEFVFQTREDILDTQWDKKDIFAHTVLNTNDFGKLTVMPDGNIYANVNFSPIGALGNSIKGLVHQELTAGKIWCRTRDMIEPCCGCLYKYLCPSLSNYETAIGRNNLCNMSR